MDAHSIIVLGASHHEITNSNQLTVNSSRSYTYGSVLFIDSRQRSEGNAANVSAANFTVNIPEQYQDVGVIELLQMTLPVPAGVGNESHALFRMRAQQLQVERGKTSNNQWFTEVIPLTSVDTTGYTTLKVTQDSIRPLKWRVPAENKLSLVLQFELLFWNTALVPPAYAPYPFAVRRWGRFCVRGCRR